MTDEKAIQALIELGRSTEGEQVCVFDLGFTASTILHGLLRLALRHPGVQDDPRVCGERIATYIEGQLKRAGASQELIDRLNEGPQG